MAGGALEDHDVPEAPRAPRGLSRRGIIRGGIGALGVAAAGAIGFEALDARTGSVASARYPVSALLAADAATHFVRRATFGPTPALINEVRKVGIAAWIDREAATPAEQIDPLRPALEATLPRLAESPAELYAQRTSGGQGVLMDLAMATAARAAFSPRQLHEVMTMFWQDHFNVYLRSGDGTEFRADYDRAIRSASLTSFSQLLRTVELHPAMLRYLNANVSTKQNPNENLGREMLELHTIGIGNYGQPDVVAAAQLLTGLTVSNSAFAYAPGRHYVGPVSIAGFHTANASAASGLSAITAYLDYLAHHPATAKRIATKLATRFVSDTPSASLIATLAKTYLDNDTRIVPVLKALFTSSEFAASVGAKLRPPLGDAIATIRILGFPQDLSAAGLKRLLSVMQTVQQLPYDHPMPDGYPLTADAWENPSSALARMNAHYDLAVARPVSALFATAPRNWGALVDATAAALVLTTLRPEHRAALLAFVGKREGDPVTAIDLNSKLPTVVAPAILSSPYHWSC